MFSATQDVGSEAPGAGRDARTRSHHPHHTHTPTHIFERVSCGRVGSVGLLRASLCSCRLERVRPLMVAGSEPLFLYSIFTYSITSPP